MIQVLFENSNGKTRTIGEAITLKEAYEVCPRLPPDFALFPALCGRLRSRTV